MTGKRPIVVGTIGHVDHGKTTLTAALMKAGAAMRGVGEAAERAAEVMKEYGDTARVAPKPYKPNRKQRRAQKARKRSK